MRPRGCAGGMWARIAWSLIACSVSIVADAAAAGPLKLEVRPLATQPRPVAPEWVEVRLTSSATHLLEGVLELNIVDDGATSLISRTQELDLTTGPRVFRLLLPTPARAALGLEREVGARFLGRSGTLELGRFPLHTRIRAAHTLVLAVGRTNLRAGDSTTRLWQSLRPERFAPKTALASLESVSTTPVFIEPEDFPADPLTYCAFDTVVLEPEVFGRLKEKPLTALGQWLAAGGSVALFGLASLDEAHVEPLRAWLLSDPQTRRFEFEFDAAGRVHTRGAAPILAHVGLGRLVVFARLPETPEEFDTAEWRRATAFLWKVRGEFATAIEREGQWKPADRQTLRNESYERSQIGTELTQALLPKTVRVIPLPVIIGILVIFIIVVGPVDYLLLGKLRLRKLTWIVFPLVSVAFTVLTMKLAAHYLGTNTHHGTFVLTDLGADGQALRETRYELILPPRPQTLVRETQHAFTIAVPGSEYDSDIKSEPAVIDGQYPARYAFRFPAQQWTPHLRRVTSLSSASDESRVDWAAFAGSQYDLDFAVSGMRGSSGCTFAVLHRGQVRIDAAEPLSSAFFARITFPQKHTIHPLISQLSPTGGGSFDDLAMLDPEDTRTVVIAMRREGRDIYAWRRLYSFP